jgi:hypothetical protein
VALRIGVARNDDAVADQQRLAMKLRGGAVRAGVVEPDLFTSGAIERVERPGAGPENDRVTDDRRRDEDSTVCIETPECL